MKYYHLFILTICSCWSSWSMAQMTIIPAPFEFKKAEDVFDFNDQTRIFCSDEAVSEAQYFVNWLQQERAWKGQLERGTQFPDSNFIFIQVKVANQGGMQENTGNLMLANVRDVYQLVVSHRHIAITAGNPSGAFYALQSLRQLFPVGSSSSASIPCCLVRDYPAYRHRGLLLDCSRHFMSKEFVMQTIDLISQYKMNVLHWHLTEDQGWRIQIDKYPLLTEVGAWRIEKDGTRYGGYYTKDDIREIVAYAKARHVEVIPEIELPGHSVAALAAYPNISCMGLPLEVENEWGVFKDIYCAGNDTTFIFLKDVLTEVCELFPSQYIHIGGDEAPKFRWENCTKCQNRIHEHHLKNEAELQTWFIEEIAHFLETKNKRIIGWDEILEGGIPADAVIQSWRGMEGGLHAAQQHHEVVMSPTSHCYLDYPLSSIDVPKIYSFDPLPSELPDSLRAYIRGAEGNLWSEHAPQELAHTRIFPRIIALSEVLWTAPKNRNYAEFESRLIRDLQRLDQQKVQYGFVALPIQVTTESRSEKEITVSIQTNTPGTSIQVDQYKLGETQSKRLEQQGGKLELKITKPTELEITANWRGKQYDQMINRIFYPHKGMSADIQLGYELNKYYPGKGERNLIDGCLGSTSFRDGNWQAIPGKDMQVVLDLKKEQRISSIKSHWYHYGNAWIFRPSHVEYFGSHDGVNWELLVDVKSSVDEKTDGESIVPFEYLGGKKKFRYIKMIAYNNGACPPWHDAAGEPSWLFCDEIVVK